MEKNFRKVLSFTLAIAMVIFYFPEVTFATWQMPVKEITNAEVTHQVDQTPGKDEILPNISLEWTIPDENDPNTKGDSNDDTLKPTSYIINVENTLDGSNKGKDVIEEVDFSKYTVSSGDRMAATFGYKGNKAQNRDGLKDVFKSGSLYKISVTPSHSHTKIDEKGNPYSEPAPLDPSKYNNAEPVYVITDFNLKANTSDGLSFEWEYIPGVTYNLYYNVVDINDAITKPIDISKNPVAVTRDNAVVTGNKIKYTVASDKIQAGQVYAACVVPKTVERSGENKLPETSKVYFNTDTPKFVYATPEISLVITDIGEGKIRLSWEMPAWLQITDANLKEINIWSRKAGESEWEMAPVATLYRNPGYFDCNKPSEDTEYRIGFDVNGIGQTLYTSIATSTVSEGVLIPFAPRVPKEFQYEIIKKMNEEEMAPYLDRSHYSKYLTKYDTIYDDIELTYENVDKFKEHTFHYTLNDGNKADVQLVWDAPVGKEEGEVNYDLYYDIWIADTKEGLNQVDKYYSDLRLSESDAIKRSDGTVVGLKTKFDNLAVNKTYYIKMIAKSKKGETKYKSLPTIVSIAIEKVGDVYNPPSLGKPPLQIQAEKDGNKNTLTIKWTEEWYEILAKDYNQYSDDGEKKFAQYGMGKVFLYTEGTEPYLRYIEKKDVANEAYELYGKKSDVLNKLKLIENKVDDHYSSGYYSEHFIENYVTLGSDTRYDIYVMKESEADALRGDRSLEEWVAGFKAKEWQDISDNIVDTTVSGIDGKKFSIIADHEGNELEANTTYVVLLRTSRIVDGEVKYCIMPSYILGTTLSGHIVNPVVPKTPKLEFVEATSSSIKVKWLYDDTFNYILKYSRLDDPDQAEVWEFTDEDKKTFVDGKTAYATITGLLPDTTYNIWIQAQQKSENVPEGNEQLTSDYSTPVTRRTKTIDAPKAPDGLGLASEQSILEAGKDFKPRGEGYLTIEWTRIADEVNNKDTRYSYQYIIEMADNPSFMDAVVVNTGEGASDGESGDSSDNNTGNENKDENNDENKDEDNKVSYEIVSKNIVKFSGLNPNASYYFRVKTVLNFVDGDKKITKESDFTEYIRLLTDKSDSEYDGGNNPNVIIFPEPVVETFKDNVWTYEIVDAAKITSQITNNKDYNYTITLENYKNKYDAMQRRIKMPIKVMNTIANQGMNLQVITNIAIYEIPGEALKRYLKQHQESDIIQFSFIKQSASDITTYIRSYPEVYESGEKLDIMLIGNDKSSKVNVLDQSMNVKLKLDVVGSYNYTDYRTYQYNYMTGIWQPYTYKVDTKDNKYLDYSTNTTGLNALYSRSIQNGNSNSSYLMNALASTYNITGLGSVYTQTDSVSAPQYVSLMIGIATNSQSIDLTQEPTQKMYESAKNAGIYVSGSRGKVTREQALAGVVKLYELKHKNKIKPSKIVFSGVSSNYSEAVSKAYAIGMIEQFGNPQGTITYGELCDWIACAVD